MQYHKIERFKLIRDGRLTSPPVRTARSRRPSFLFSPKPGALMAQTCRNDIHISLANNTTPVSRVNQKENKKYCQPPKNKKSTLIPARSLFRTRVAKASLSTSSATISKGLCL